VASRPVVLERMKLPVLLLAAALLLLSACGSARVPPTPPKTVTPQCMASCRQTPAPQTTSLTPQQAASAAAAAGTPDVTGSCTLLYAGTGGQTFPNTPAGLQQEHAVYISPPSQVAQVTITNQGIHGFTVKEYSIEVYSQGAVVGDSQPQQAGQFLAPGETFTGNVDLTSSHDISQMSDATFQSASCDMLNWGWS